MERSPEMRLVRPSAGKNLRLAGVTIGGRGEVCVASQCAVPARSHAGADGKDGTKSALRALQRAEGSRVRPAHSKRPSLRKSGRLHISGHPSSPATHTKETHRG